MKLLNPGPYRQYNSRLPDPYLAHVDGGSDELNTLIDRINYAMHKARDRKRQDYIIRRVFKKLQERMVKDGKR